MIALERPSTELLPSYLDLVAEMERLGETVWAGRLPSSSESPSNFVERILRREHSPEAGLVPESVYWAVEDGRVVGRIALRHRLDASLEEFGGHVGYEVRPSARGRGIGREMLRLLLELPKAKEIGRLLITCSPDNLASVHTILANGGVLSRTAFVEKWHRETSYYWIQLG